MSETNFDFSVLETIPDTDAEIEVPEEVLEGPQTEEEQGVASLILDAISNSANTIQMYNAIIANCTDEEIVDSLNEILVDENRIMGKLQSILQKVSPNAEEIMNGAIEDSGLDESFTGVTNLNGLTNIIVDILNNSDELEDCDINSIGESFRITVNGTRYEYTPTNSFKVDESLNESISDDLKKVNLNKFNIGTLPYQVLQFLWDLSENGKLDDRSLERQAKNILELINRNMFDESLILHENGSISRRKKEFINKFGHIIAGVNSDSDIIDSSCLQQHHIDANTDNNPDDFSNFAYLYSANAAHARLAHNYIHAKALVNNYNLNDVLYISSNGKTAKASKEILDSIALKLPNNFETKEVLFTDDSAISESLNEGYNNQELISAVQSAYGYNKKEAKDYIKTIDDKSKEELIKGFKRNAKKSFLTDSLKENEGYDESKYIVWYNLDGEENYIIISALNEDDAVDKFSINLDPSLITDVHEVVDYGYHAESLEEDKKITRYSDVLPQKDRDRGWWYFTTHGVGPGTIPKDLNVLEVRDGQNKKGTWGTFVRLDGIVNTSELSYYDLIELAPHNAKNESLNESARENINQFIKNYLEHHPFDSAEEMIDYLEDCDEIEELEDRFHTDVEAAIEDYFEYLNESLILDESNNLDTSLDDITPVRDEHNERAIRDHKKYKEDRKKAFKEISKNAKDAFELDESLFESFYLNYEDSDLLQDWDQGGLDFSVDIHPYKYEFYTSRDANKALKIAISHGYKDSWREGHYVYLTAH